jgi:hypothetical protein
MYLKDENSGLAKSLLKRSNNEVAIKIEPLSLITYDDSDR